VAIFGLGAVGLAVSFFSNTRNRWFFYPFMSSDASLLLMLNLFLLFDMIRLLKVLGFPVLQGLLVLICIPVDSMKVKQSFSFIISLVFFCFFSYCSIGVFSLSAALVNYYVREDVAERILALSTY
jgi:hypothetical protein